MTADTADKVRENRLRRMAERQGLRLVKSSRRDPRALDFGKYWLRNPFDRNRVILGEKWGCDLDAIDEYLSR